MIVKFHMRLDVTFFKKIHSKPVLENLYFSKVIKVLTILSLKEAEKVFVRSWISPFSQANKLVVSLMLSVKMQDY